VRSCSIIRGYVGIWEVWKHLLSWKRPSQSLSSFHSRVHDTSFLLCYRSATTIPLNVIFTRPLPTHNPLLSPITIISPLRLPSLLYMPKPLAKLGCLGVFSCCVMSGLRTSDTDGILGRMKVFEEMTWDSGSVVPSAVHC
jgi:hypothetical protein